jgi:hypothetical protein
MLFRHLLVAAIVVGAAAAVVVPFLIGYRKGPAAEPAAPDGQGAQLYRPLSRVVTLYGRFLVLYVLAELFRASYGSFSGQSPIVCATTPATTAGGGGSGLVVRAGAVLQSNGAVQVCTAHPTGWQWFLYGLIRLPGQVFWIVVLLLAWQLIRQAARSGPFSARTAAIMQRLGLVIVAGTAVAAAISALGSDLLDGMLVASGGFAGAAVPLDFGVYEPLKALLPWPALAGAALISFARITRAGAVLDEEVRATV